MLTISNWILIFCCDFLAAFTQSCHLFIMAFGGRLFSFSSVYSKLILTRDFHLQYIDCFDISPRLRKTFHIDLSKNYVPSQYNMSQTFNLSFVFICLKRCVLHDVNMFFNCFFFKWSVCQKFYPYTVSFYKENVGQRLTFQISCVDRKGVFY